MAINQKKWAYKAIRKISNCLVHSTGLRNRNNEALYQRLLFAIAFIENGEAIFKTKNLTRSSFYYLFLLKPLNLLFWVRIREDPLCSELYPVAHHVLVDLADYLYLLAEEIMLDIIEFI